jgi:sugar/nucleoside kinase (ribokinase family)
LIAGADVKNASMLLSCGDALIDFLPVKSVDGRDAAVPVAGGSCLNVAVGMARLGAPTGFVGGISTDLFGRMIADHALASQVELRFAVRSEHQTTLAFVRTVASEPQYAFSPGVYISTTNSGRSAATTSFPVLPCTEHTAVFSCEAFRFAQKRTRPG